MTILANLIADCRESVGEMNGIKTITIGKGTILNGIQPIGKGYAWQFLADIKSFLPDAPHGMGQLDAGQAFTMGKGTVTNGYYRIR